MEKLWHPYSESASYWLVTLILLCALVTGCRATPVPTATPTAVPTATVRPTAIPTATPLPPTATAVPSPTPEVIHLTLLHSNDTHGHLEAFRIAEFPDPVGGMARRFTLVNQIRAETPNVLLVDAGDFHQGILMADTFKGEPDLAFMNRLNYAAMGLGNHDLDWGWDSLQARIAAAKFPILCANLVYSATGEPALQPYVIQEAAGLKIAFTSFMGPEADTLIKPENIPGMIFTDPIATARTLIPELRQQADVVIVLGHQYQSDDKALARAVPGIDIIVGGHDHMRLNEPLKVGNTVLVEAWQFGAFLGRLDLTFTDGKLTASTGQLLPVANAITPDPTVEAEIQQLAAELRELRPERYEVIGEARGDITDTDVRRREAALGNFVTDLIRAEARADLALTTASSFLNSLFKGPVTVNAVWEAIPYKNSLVTLNLTGAQVRQILEFSAQSSGKGGFSQVSGVTFVIDGDAVSDIQIAGAPLDDKKLYRVATTNYQAQIAYGYKDIFKEGKNYYDTGTDIRTLVIDSIRAQQTISATLDGRITVK